jgi:hypothetical protein
MKRDSRLPAILLLSLPAMTTACGGGGGGGGGGPGGPVFDHPAPVEPTAGAWRTWVVADVPALRPAPPPAPGSQQTQDEIAELQALAAARTPSVEAAIDEWNEGTVKEWNEFARELVSTRPISPPRASRLYALLSVACHDAAVAAWDAKYAYLRARPSAHPGAPAVYGPEPATPSYVSERAAVSAAAAVTLTHLYPESTFPGAPAQIAAFLQSAFDADLYAGVQFRSDVLAGEALGESVGAQVIAYAQTDGADGAQTPYTESGVAGLWERTPQNDGSPAAFPPVLPGWGGVRTWVLPSGDAIRPVGPPVYESSEWNLQSEEVHDVSLANTPEREAIADLWAGGPGTETPPGQWNTIACDLGVADGLNEPRFARMLAAVNVAQADAFVACWECKYAYDCCRPITEIRAKIDAAWLPYVNTPPFPSYPSGHSSTSGAASQTLAAFFPSSATEIAMLGTEAKDSRLYGGIHFRFDNDVGLDMGRVVANAVLSVVADDGAD